MRTEERTIRVSPVLYAWARGSAAAAGLSMGMALGYAVGEVAGRSWLLDALAARDEGTPGADAEPMIPRVVVAWAEDDEWDRFLATAETSGMSPGTALRLLVHAIGRGDLSFTVSVRVRRSVRANTTA